MKVNINNLRKQALYTYDRLCNVLNDKNDEGNIEVLAEDIQDEMDMLRMQLLAIACVYQEGDEEFKDVSDEVGEIATFNEEPEND